MARLRCPVRISKNRFERHFDCPIRNFECPSEEPRTYRRNLLVFLHFRNHYHEYMKFLGRTDTCRNGFGLVSTITKLSFPDYSYVYILPFETDECGICVTFQILRKNRLKRSLKNDPSTMLSCPGKNGFEQSITLMAPFI
jgi:hypothetical protein